MLTLTVADAGNGSGGVATVSGADSGTPLTVYYQPLSVLESNTAWTLGGTRTGNGAIPVTASGTGSYFWTASGTVNGAGVYTPPFCQSLTNESAVAPHWACMVAFQQRLWALNLFAALEGATPLAQRVQLCWTGKDAITVLLTRPGIAIFPWTAEATVDIEANADTVEYPTVVALIDNNTGPQANLARNLWWRWQLFLNLRQQRVPGVPSTVTTPVAPQNVIVPELQNNDQIFYSALLLRPRSRELRPV